MRLAAEVAGSAHGLFVATVDHGLRPGSRAEAEQVALWARECGLAHSILAWTGETPRTRIQEIARRRRYELLVRFAADKGASHILTGHTLDDQAETVVMRLLSGSGIRGLSGMRAESALAAVTLARPFLDLRKSRLVATCRAAGWPFLDDPSNADPRFARARLREALMPALAAEGLTAERAGRLARRAERAADALAARVEDVLGAAVTSRAVGRLALDGAALLAEPEAIRLGVLARAIAIVLGGTVKPLRSDRFERIVLEELSPALRAGRALKRTIAGALIDAGTSGCVIVTAEPPRRGLTSA